MIDERYQLNITLTNGTTLELGNIRGADGAKGDKGEKGDTGAAGADGKDGQNGTDGVGVQETAVNEQG